MNKLIVLTTLLITACGSNFSSPASISSPGQIQPTDEVVPVEFCPSIPPTIGFEESGLYINNVLYAVYYDGSHTFLTLLSPNIYVTTDGRNCHFQVNSDYSLTWL